MGPWNITGDGWFMPDEPGAVFKAGKQNRVPLITVANLGELSGRGPIPGGLMIPGYVNLLLGVAKAGAKGYAAIFDQVPRIGGARVACPLMLWNCTTFSARWTILIPGRYSIFFTLGEAPNLPTRSSPMPTEGFLRR
jgi:hypothetical protein